MKDPQPGLLTTLVERFAPRLKHPQLFLLVLTLFLVDLVVVDPIPFVDEALLALLTLLLGSWRRRRPRPTPPADDGPSVKDVTDRGSDDGRASGG